MATFLQICQDVARESGTIPNVGDPATAQGQTGRLLRLVNWVQDAWLDIQREQDAWRWLEKEFTASLIVNKRDYSAGDLNIASRFADWKYSDVEGTGLFTMYKTSEGQSTEQVLAFKEWDSFRRQFMLGQALTQPGTPMWFSINPENQVVLYPTPDVAHTLRGVYRRGPQSLSADDDAPEMPDRFHKAIQWRALVLLAIFDEAPIQLPVWQSNFNAVMARLREDQLPRVQDYGPLA